MTETLDQPWELSPLVALRPESFGALAYHFGNRRLTFLKRRELVDVICGLDDAPDVRTALTRAKVPQAQWNSYVRTLRDLAEADMIRQRHIGVDAGEGTP